MKRILSILFIITFGVNIFASDIMTVSACSNEMTNYDEHDTKEENSNFDRGKPEESAAKNISISADVAQNENLQETNNSSTLSNQEENKNEEVKSDVITTEGVEQKISLNTPQNIIVNKTYNSINLKWDPVDNASEYEVEIDGIAEITNAVEYTSEGLNPEEQHTYIVRAISGTSNSEWSEAITAVTDKVLDLTVSSSITLTEDVVYKDVTIKSGTINLNGHKLTVLNTVIQTGGTVNINQGKLIIQSNYSIGGSGALYMAKETDYVLVGGNFNISTSTNGSGNFTGGTLEVKGNVTEENHNGAEYYFRQNFR